MIKAIKNFFKNNIELFYTLGTYTYIMIWVIASTELLSTLEKKYFSSLQINRTYLVLILEGLLYIVGIFLPYFIYKIAFNHKISFSLKFNKYYLNNILLSVFIGFVIQPFGMGISALSSLICGSNTVQELTEMFDLNCNTFLVCFTLAILPAVIEELIFRDLIFKNLNKKYSAIVSAIISGLLFGIYHLNFQQFLYAAAIGYVLAIIYGKTRNVLYTIIIHFVINFSQLLLSFSLLKLESQIKEASEVDMPVEVTDLINAPYILSFILIIILFSLWLKHLIKKYKVSDDDLKSKSENTIENNN